VTWVKWKVASVRLEMVLMSARLVHGLCLMYHGHGNRFGCTQWNSGYVGQMEARFSPFGDCVNLDTRLVHGLCQTYDRLRNQFGRT
jgi:hypothetical protein